MSVRQARNRGTVNYSEKAVGGEPAWVAAQKPTTSGGSERHSSGKENEREKAAKKAAKPGDKAVAGKKKAASQSVPTRGQNAGLTVLPIKDLRQQEGDKGAERKIGVQTKKPSSQGDSSGEQRRLKKNVEKPLERAHAAVTDAAPTSRDPAPESQAPMQAIAAAAHPSGKQGSSGASKKRGAAGAQARQDPLQQPAAKRQQATTSGQPAAGVPPEKLLESQHQLPGRQAGPRSAAAPAAAVQQVKPLAQGAAGGTEVLARITRAVEAAVQAQIASVPAAQNCERCQHFSDNFTALLDEFQGLQREYEALKAAKLSQDVEELLKEHNKRVTEHGAKAAELAGHWKLEAEKRQQEAEHYAQLLQRSQKLESDLLTAQEAIIEQRVLIQQRETYIQELEARNEHLEQRVNIPTMHDKDIQTDGLAAQSAGVQAPSLVSPGVQMYEARAMAPEGAEGTVYKKRGRPAAASPYGATAAPTDPTYTIPGTTNAPALAENEWLGDLQHDGQEVAQQQQQGWVAAAAGSQPAGGSDMQLTGGVAPQQQLSPVAGMVAHAAAPGGGRVATRRGSLPPSPPHQAQQAAQQQQQAAAVQQRPGSAQLTEESLVQAAVAGPMDAANLRLPQPAAQGRARRLSAPPAMGGTGSFTACNGVAPLERQLQFVSGSHEAGLPAVPEGEQEGEAHTECAAPQSVPPPPREGAVTMIGFEATPCKGGKYIYTHPASGFVFELGPALPDSEDDEEALEEELCYCALDLGSIAHALPEFLHSRITIAANSRHKLMHLLWGALAKAGQ